MSAASAAIRERDDAWDEACVAVLIANGMWPEDAWEHVGTLRTRLGTTKTPEVVARALLQQLGWLQDGDPFG